MLLDAGADVAATSEQGATALHIAAFMGHGEVVTVLLDSGAEVGARDANQNTPQMLAVPRFNKRRQAFPFGGTDPEETRRGLVRAAYAEVVLILRAPQDLAFAMGHQERLGATSWVRRLDPELVRMVLDLV